MRRDGTLRVSLGLFPKPDPKGERGHKTVVWFWTTKGTLGSTVFEERFGTRVNEDTGVGELVWYRL